MSGSMTCLISFQSISHVWQVFIMQSEPIAYFETYQAFVVLFAENEALSRRDHCNLACGSYLKPEEASWIAWITNPEPVFTLAIDKPESNNFFFFFYSDSKKARSELKFFQFCAN